MSLERERAMLLRVPSTINAPSPAEARAWLVKVMRRLSSPLENAPTYQASTALGNRRPMTMAAAGARRRGHDRRLVGWGCGAGGCAVGRSIGTAPCPRDQP